MRKGSNVTLLDARTILNAVRLGCAAHLSEATITAALRATGDIASPDAPLWRRPEPPLPVNPKRQWPYYATADGARAAA